MYLPVFGGAPEEMSQRIFFSVLFPTTGGWHIKTWVKCIEIFSIQIVLQDPQSFTETLEVHDFSGSQEFDRFDNVWIIDKPQDIVVGRAGFLLCGHIFKQVGDRIALALELTGIKRDATGGLRPDGEGMVNVIFVKTAAFDLFHGKVSGQLVDDDADHFEVG